MYEIDVSKSQDVSGESIFHTVCRHSAFCDVVSVVTVGMLDVLHPARPLEVSCCCLVIGLVKIEFQDVEPLLAIAQVMVAPEIVIYVTGTHHGCLTALVGVETLRRVLRHVITECVLKVGRGSSPATPAVTELIEALWHQVTLQGVLACPLRAHCPAPCDQALVGIVVRSAEDVLVVLHQLSARVVYHVERCCRSLLQILAVQRPADTGSREQHFCIEPLGAVVVDTAVSTLGPGQQLHGLFKCHQYIFVDVSLLNLR